jgi:hypothetical protein
LTRTICVLGDVGRTFPRGEDVDVAGRLEMEQGVEENWKEE